MNHQPKSLLSVSLILFSLLFFLSPNITFAKPRKPEQKQVLRVALFPYIPDAAHDNYKALLTKIEKDFESKNHSIDLQLRPLNQEADDFYDIEKLKTFLSSNTTDNSYDLVEVDTLLLDDLVKSGLISNWKNTLKTKDWNSVAYQASVINNQIYGVPHWMCGHFIFSHDESISKSTSITELIKSLDNADSSIPKLTADLTGSWNIPAIYLDVWADTYGASTVAKGLNANLDTEVINQLKLLSDECKTEGKNPCLESGFHANDVPALLFAQNKSDAFLGYSERLNFILSQNNSAKNVYITSAPIGKGSNPILFVDSLVKRASCNLKCEDASVKFTTYLNSPKFQEWVLMSKDSSSQAVPRYLIPATKSAFNQKLIRKDKYYMRIKSEIKSGQSFPNTGFPEIRSNMKTSILTELNKP